MVVDQLPEPPTPDPGEIAGLREQAYEHWAQAGVDAKLDGVQALWAQVVGVAGADRARGNSAIPGVVSNAPGARVLDTAARSGAGLEPGRPARPRLVDPRKVPRRGAGGARARAGLLHAIAHIEFNAINLALDAVWRYPAMPQAFALDWLAVAADECRHFGLVRALLREAGHDYGDFDAHDGLWQMAVRTHDDLLARMALVPRVLEARGLDATPPIQARLRAAGDEAACAVLQIILDDEIGHVRLGDHWFRLLAAQAGLDPEAAYLGLIEQHGAPMPRAPLNRDARLAAGFSERELGRLEAR
ncbi:MAG: ferritin-like domain-containing protein [Burkholderiaceae bacterium]